MFLNGTDGKCVPASRAVNEKAIIPADDANETAAVLFPLPELKSACLLSSKGCNDGFNQT